MHFACGGASCADVSCDRPLIHWKGRSKGNEREEAGNGRWDWHTETGRHAWALTEFTALKPTVKIKGKEISNIFPRKDSYVYNIFYYFLLFYQQLIENIKKTEWNKNEGYYFWIIIIYYSDINRVTKYSLLCYRNNTRLFRKRDWKIYNQIAILKISNAMKKNKFKYITQFRYYASIKIQWFISRIK